MPSSAHVLFICFERNMLPLSVLEFHRPTSFGDRLPEALKQTWQIFMPEKLTVSAQSRTVINKSNQRRLLNLLQTSRIRQPNTITAIALPERIDMPLLKSLIGSLLRIWLLFLCTKPVEM